MKKYIRNGKEYRVGSNPKLGLLIYDPDSQLDVSIDKVRLFKIKDKKTGVFIKNIIKAKLTKFSEQENTIIDKAINEYTTIKNNRRVTHCYQCKSHLDSVDFSICHKCKWIKCSCGACGCMYGL